MAKLVKILDECLALIKAGGTIEQCLEKYPEAEKIKSLLETAEKLIKTDKVKSSQGFRKTLRRRLLQELNKTRKKASA